MSASSCLSHNRASLPHCSGIVFDFCFSHITHPIHQQTLLALLSKHHPLRPLFIISATTIHASAWITQRASYLVSACLLLPFTVWVLHSGSDDFFKIEIISHHPFQWLPIMLGSWTLRELGPADLSAVIPNRSPLPSLISATLAFLPSSTHPSSFPPQCLGELALLSA